MRWIILLSLVLILVFISGCFGTICQSDADCPEGNGCEGGLCVYAEGDDDDDEPGEYYNNGDDDDDEPTESDIYWESMNGPPGGHMNQLIQSPIDADVLYALPSTRIVHKTDDKGETWEQIEELIDTSISSIAAHEDNLFACGGNVYYYNELDGLVEISNEACDNLFISNDKLFITEGENELSDIKISYVDLSSGNYNFIEITPSISELNELEVPETDEFQYHISFKDIVSIEDKILTIIEVFIDGSGEETNSVLYNSEDLGNTWDHIDFVLDERIMLERIIQDPNDENHLLLALRQKMVRDTEATGYEYLRESVDAGETWDYLTTELTLEIDGILDIGITADNYYFLCTYDDLIIKYDGQDYEEVDMPFIDDYEEMNFCIDRILFDLNNPDIIYAKTGETWALGLVKSEDDMQTWNKMDSGITASSPTIVMAHPTDLDTLFTSGNIMQESYLTRDNGQTWEPFTPVAAGDEVRIDPHNYDHLLLITEGTSIYESYDNGNSFTEINEDFSSAKIFDFEIANDGSGNIYVANLGLGISEYTFSDNANPWAYMTGSPDYTYTIEIDPDDSEIVYASYSPKIFEDYSSILKYDPDYEDNFGWEEILRIEDSTGITTLEFDPSNSDKIYTGVVGERGKIYTSDNKGEDWDLINDIFTFTTIHEIAIDPNNENIVYAAPWGGGLFKSENNGENWEELTTPTISIVTVIVDPTNSNHLLIGDRTKPKVYESYDQGDSWNELIALDEDDYYRISTVGLHNGELYFSVFNKINGLISLFDLIMNGPMSGTTFRYDGNLEELGGDLEKVAINIFSDGSDVYAVGHIFNVFRLNGDDWEDISGNLPDSGFNNLIVDDQNSLYVTGASDIDTDGNFRVNGDVTISTEIYKSEDNGNTWNPILGNNLFPSPAKKLLQHPTNMDVLIAGTGNGIYVSTDRGITWNQENNGLEFENIGSMTIGENYIYVGTSGGGVYSGRFDNDYSIEWHDSTGPYPEIYNIQIKVDPTNSNIIYATSYPGGVFKSTDQGANWVEANFAMPSFEVEDPKLQGYYSLEIDPNNPDILYLGIFSKGVYKSYDGAGTWIPMYGNMGQNAYIMEKEITKVKVDPSNSDHVYLATSDSGVYFSDDGAESWEEMNDGLQTLDIKSLKVANIEYNDFTDNFENGNANEWELDQGWSVTQDNNNYVLEGIGHEWATTGLENWRDYTFEFKLKLIERSIHLNARINDEGRYYVTFSGDGVSLGKSTDGWSQHNEITSVEENYNLDQWYDIKIEVYSDNIKFYVDNILKIDYTDPNPYYSGSIAFESLEDSHIYIDDVNVEIEPIGTAIYAGTAGYGLYSYDSSTEEWTHHGRTLGNGYWTPWERGMYQFSSILFDPDTSGKIYFGGFPGGFFISEDNGHSWKDSSLGIGNDGIFSLSMHPNDHNILYAGTYNGIFKSTDQGQTWEMKAEGMPSEQWPYTVAIDSDNPNIMYTSTKNGQNKGFCHRNEFCGVVMKSTDGAESWFEIIDGLEDESEFYNLIIYPEDHDVLFLSTNNGVYISTNAGDSWEQINDGLPSTDNQVRDNVADNLVLTPDNNYLIFGLMDRGVWKAEINLE